LEQATAQITAVVKAERPANRPTLKGLIHNDVDKTTEELHYRVQSLEAKLTMAKNGTADNKRSKTKSKMGTVTAPSKKPVNKKTKATPKKTPAKSKLLSLVASNSTSNAAAKKQKGVHSKNKSPGKKQGKPTATCK
jgi:hypothetical protein